MEINGVEFTNQELDLWNDIVNGENPEQYFQHGNPVQNFVAAVGRKVEEVLESVFGHSANPSPK